MKSLYIQLKVFQEKIRKENLNDCSIMREIIGGTHFPNATYCYQFYSDKLIHKDCYKDIEAELDYIKKKVKIPAKYNIYFKQENFRSAGTNPYAITAIRLHSKDFITKKFHNMFTEFYQAYESLKKERNELLGKCLNIIRSIKKEKKYKALDLNRLIHEKDCENIENEHFQQFCLDPLKKIIWNDLYGFKIKVNKWALRHNFPLTISMLKKYSDKILLESSDDTKSPDETKDAPTTSAPQRRVKSERTVVNTDSDKVIVVSSDSSNLTIDTNDINAVSPDDILSPSTVKSKVNSNQKKQSEQDKNIDLPINLSSNPPPLNDDDIKEASSDVDQKIPSKSSKTSTSISPENRLTRTKEYDNISLEPPPPPSKLSPDDTKSPDEIKDDSTISEPHTIVKSERTVVNTDSDKFINVSATPHKLIDSSLSSSDSTNSLLTPSNNEKEIVDKLKQYTKTQNDAKILFKKLSLLSPDNIESPDKIEILTTPTTKNPKEVKLTRTKEYDNISLEPPPPPSKLSPDDTKSPDETKDDPTISEPHTIVKSERTVVNTDSDKFINVSSNPSNLIIDTNDINAVLPDSVDTKGIQSKKVDKSNKSSKTHGDSSETPPESPPVRLSSDDKNELSDETKDDLTASVSKTVHEDKLSPTDASLKAVWKPEPKPEPKSSKKKTSKKKKTYYIYYPPYPFQLGYLKGYGWIYAARDLSRPIVPQPYQNKNYWYGWYSINGIFQLGLLQGYSHIR
jgi:hypothetical protein